MIKKIILIYGLPGTGKTSLAKLVSYETGYKYLSSEMVRAKILKVNRVIEDCDFTLEEQDIVYRKMQLLAEKALLKDDGIIIEGVFRSKEQRQIMYNLKDKIQNVKFYPFYIICDRNIALERVRSRKTGITISPAGVKTYCAIEKIFELTNKDEPTTIIINNSNDINSSLKKILNCRWH